MFTNKKAKYYGDNKVLLDSACLSSDTKPTTGVANGSKLLEMDTSTVYAFDEANGEWLAQSSSGGGGNMVVNATVVESTVTLGKTWKEINDAMSSGMTVYFKMPDDEYYADAYYLLMGSRCNVLDNTWTLFADYNSSGVSAFTAQTENGYPSYTYQ